MPHGLTSGTESIPARVKALGFASYRDYLQSEHWQEFKVRLFKTSAICKRIRKKYGEMRCYFCAGRGPLNVHHKTYKRLGVERMDDVFVICKDCHERIHKKQKETGKGLHESSPRLGQVPRRRREQWMRRFGFVGSCA